MDRIAELTARAEALPATITAATSAEDATRIEREHGELLTEIRDLQTVKEICTREGFDFSEFASMNGMQARQAVLTAMATRSAASSPPSNSALGYFPGGLDETETRREGLSQALAGRLAEAGGVKGYVLPPIARQYGAFDFHELAGQASGWKQPLRNRAQIEKMYTRAMLTTSDFPDILTNAFNVRLLARYQTALPTYRRWAAPYTAPDFRALPVIRAGDFPALQPVNEDGEIKFGSFSESKESVQVKSYAVRMNFSRQLMINDQLQAIDQMLGSAGVRVADWENEQMYALLTSASGLGPDLLTDSTPLFDVSAHNNYTSSGTAISVTTIGLGRSQMMRQTTLDGLKANFQPAILLVSPEKLTLAEQQFATLYPAQTTEAVPDSIKRLLPIADANLTGNAWYLFADPNMAPCFIYALLQGFEGPRMQSEQLFDVQGLRVKLDHDFGVAAIDFRGGYRNAGA